MLTVGLFCSQDNVYAQTLQKRTQQEILEMAKELPYTFEDVTYASKPSSKYPYSAGQVSEKALEEALNAVNMVRYIAGLPADVTLDASFNEYAQYASVVDAANGVLTHYPEQPSDMPEDFYNKGADGAGSSNMGCGFDSITESILAYMSDSDSSNIDRLGHRRWILNPEIARIGFGMAGSNESEYYNDNYTATYVLDYSRTDPISYDYITWPAEQMPLEYFYYGDAWSVNLGAAYETPSLDQVM
jgi:uncharacterized protein YkwD